MLYILLQEVYWKMKVIRNSHYVSTHVLAAATRSLSLHLTLKDNNIQGSGCVNIQRWAQLCIGAYVLDKRWI